MATGQHTGRWIAAGLGICVVAGVALVATFRPFLGKSVDPTATEATGSPLNQLSVSARAGNSSAVEALLAKLDPKVVTEPTISETEATELVEVVGALRAGFLQFSPKARLAALATAAAVLDRYGKANAPGTWVEVLGPVHDLLNGGLGDADSNVRAVAMDVIARAWGWAPNRSLLPIEENVLAEWKQGFHTGVVRCLADPHETARASAVACLGALPMDRAAAPAVAYVDDASPMVRRQVLSSFARRTGILTEDAILARTNDSEPDIAQMAEVVLRGRGLTGEQIGLGRMILHPKPEVRASVIALLKDRTDIDPMTWLLQLSRDKDETVRSQAVTALATHADAPEARKRLREMASADSSEIIRATAAKHAAATSDTTAALPPLPGSPSLNPKAN